MSAETVAAAHYRRQTALARRIAREVAALWRALDRSDLDGSWAVTSARLVALVVGAQALAAAQADGYLDDVLTAQGIDPASDGRVNSRALAGVASDGRPLDSLLFEPIIAVKGLIGQGMSSRRAMASGLLRMDMIVRTQIADAGRVADGVATVARRHVGGYVRMLSPPSCSRCAVLAGKFYRWNIGFQRHPRCDCRHIPTSEDRSGDLRTDPRAYFDSLSRSEQDKVFTVAGAQAIRDGADIAQVVNARRGAAGLAPAGARLTREELRAILGDRDRGRLTTTRIFGQDLFVTTEGITRRGLAGKRLEAAGSGLTRRAGQRVRSVTVPRLMPESIYRIAAGDREEALRLLRRFGYIL